MGLDQLGMMCIHHESVIGCIALALKVLCVVILPPPTHGTHSSFTVSIRVPFPGCRRLGIIPPVVFPHWLLSLSRRRLRFLHITMAGELFFFFCLFRAAPAAFGGSQPRGRMGATAAPLHHSHSNSRSEPQLRPTPQLTAMLDPEPTEQDQGSNLYPHGYWSDSLLSHDGNS